MTDFSDIGAAYDAVWEPETVTLSKLETSRVNNDLVNPNMLNCREIIYNLAEKFNKSQNSVKLSKFKWCKADDKDTTPGNSSPTDAEILEAKYSVFGLRFGSESPTSKIIVICHLDVVPATASGDWDPYNPKMQKNVEYPSGNTGLQDFLVGRGCVDDKGPAVSAFVAVRCAAKLYDSNKNIFDDGLQVELLFDSSEETEMSTPHYMDDIDNNNTIVPNFGVVYDAFWTTRAEKGGERPVFTCAKTKEPSSDTIYVSGLNTSPENSSNTIPDWCQAVFMGNSKLLDDLSNDIESLYISHVFDDPNYQRADMTVNLVNDGDGKRLVLTANVKGAQHGSAPEQNRLEGSNPLVSLANFIPSLVNDRIESNYVSSMCSFIADTWGTHVFGEGSSRSLLYKFDQIFEEGNGTTYAISKTETDDKSIKMYIDIRYAIDHHEYPWDGETEGFLEGKNSVFDATFKTITENFNAKYGSLEDIDMDTQTIFAPDIRVPETNENIQSVESSFQEVMGRAPPRYAIGGGTDAKGYTFLVGAGPLFSPNMGAPINYHGIGEAAPVADMKRSTEILFQVIRNQIEQPTSNLRKLEPKVKKNLRLMKNRRAGGYKSMCNC